MALTHFFATATNKETGRPLDGVIVELLVAGVPQPLYSDRSLTPKPQMVTGVGFDPITGVNLYPEQGFGEANCYVEEGNYDIRYTYNGLVIDNQPDFPVFGSFIVYNAGYTDAVTMTLAQALKGHMVSLLNWIPTSLHAAILNNTSTVDCTTYVQDAFDNAPLNSTLCFPAGGRLEIRGQVNLNRRLSLYGNGCRWIGQFGVDVTSDFLSINVQDGDNNDCRNMQIWGFNALGFFSGGRNAIRVQATSPGVANVGLKIFNNLIGTLSTSTGYAISLEGLGVHINEVYGNQIENGIFLNCADRTVIRENNIFGNKIAVTCDLIEGAFSTEITNNALVSRDGALLVTNGSQIEFSGNQVEQFPSVGANASARQASIAVVGSTYGSRGLRIIGNNFGGGTNQRVPISLVSNCEGAIIDENVFNYGSTNLDIEILATSVKSTRIGRGNSFRGARGGFDPAWPIAINDLGEGTYNVWKDASTLALQNSWTGTAAFRYLKTTDDLIIQEGALLAGTAAGGTVIGTFPIGFRPAATTLWGGVSDVTCTASSMVVSTAGVISAQFIQAASNNYMAPLPIRGNAVYSPGA